MTRRSPALSMAACVLALAVSAAAQFPFQRSYVDRVYGGNGRPGWVEAGDMDADGDLDLVAGGGNAFYVYENVDGSGRTWQRHGNLDGTRAMGANGGILFDVDDDGDLDVVSARYIADVGWWENPGGALRTTGWAYHSLHVGVPGWFVHDFIRADLDGDGVAEEFVANFQRGYWNAPVEIWWYRRGANAFGSWDAFQVQANRAGLDHCHAGLAVADIDRDGHVDLAYSDGWYEAPDDPTQAGGWIWHREIQTVYGISNTIAADLSGDGSPDLVVAAGHHGRGVYWFEAKANGPWVQHAIDSSVPNPETLQVEDVDHDGDLDVLSTELDFSRWNQQAHQLWLYENLGGSPPQWRKHNIAPNSYPNHQAKLVDIDRDGRLDVISEAAGHSVVSYHENLATFPPPVLLHEVVAANVFGDRDEAGEREPWVELFNLGGGEIDLSGFGLSDDPAQPHRWQFPAGTLLPPRGYRRVWLDGEPGDGPLHTSFRLRNGGNTLTLCTGAASGASATIDSTTFGTLPPDVAFGRVPDGGAEWFHVFEPSGGTGAFASRAFITYDARPAGAPSGLSLAGGGDPSGGSRFSVHMRGGQPGAPAFLLVGTTPAAIPLGTWGPLHIDLAGMVSVGLVLDANGGGQAATNVPFGVAGLELAFQVLQNEFSNALFVRLR